MPTADRMRGPSGVLLAALLLVGCGVLELGGTTHEAVTLEPARADGGVWSTTVELLATEIAGASVVAITAEAGEVVCADGRALPADGVPLGTQLSFVQEEGTDDSSPPQVRGVQVEVECR